MTHFNEIIDNWKERNPLNVHQLGFHDYDGILPDISRERIAKNVSQIKADLKILEFIRTPDEKIPRYEYNLLLSTLENELSQLEVIRDYEKSPLDAIQALGIVEGSYTVRSFASVTERVKSIISLEKHIPKFLEDAKSLLKLPLAKSRVEMSSKFLAGMINFYKKNLIDFVKQSNDNSLLQKWQKVNQDALTAMEKLLKHLNELLFGSKDEFAIGEEEFLQRLKATEGVELSAEKLLKVAENEIERNFQEIKACATRLGYKNVSEMMEVIENDYPDPRNLLSYVEESLERAKQFLKDSGVVTIPTDNQCAVVPTPESFRSFAFAAMNLPGPFEVPEASESYYYVTPPESTWDKEKTDQFMAVFNRPGIESLTVHEAWPGHYLQLLYSYTTKSEIAKMFADSYALTEGWGLYTEEMVFDEGYNPLNEGGTRDRYHVGQLREAIVRDVRFFVAVSMHCRGMTVEEATKLFIEKGFLSETVAIVGANRGTVDPLYLNYTLGKLMIKKLRSDAKKERLEQNEEFSLKKFHDELLSYGSPPITVLRQMVLNNPGGSSDIL